MSTKILSQANHKSRTLGVVETTDAAGAVTYQVRTILENGELGGLESDAFADRKLADYAMSRIQVRDAEADTAVAYTSGDENALGGGANES